MTPARITEQGSAGISSHWAEAEKASGYVALHYWAWPCCSAPARPCRSFPSHDYNPAVDFAKFQSWAWKEPAVQYQPNSPMLRSDLTEQRIIQAVSAQLDQRGLRPVAAGNKPDLLVQAWLIVANRQNKW